MSAWRLGRNWKFLTVVACLGVINLGGLYVFTESSAGHSTRCELPLENKVPKTDVCSSFKNTIAMQQQLLQDLKAKAEHKTSLSQVTQPTFNASLPIIYMITPTYYRWTQKADLTRLCYTLMHVPNLHWVVVEDAEKKTKLVASLLSGIHSCKMRRTTHLNVRTPKNQRRGPKDPVWAKNRGVLQRNIALRWLREAWSAGQLQENTSGVVYFGDDDNVYDLRVFEEMRYTKKVSVWPVGLSGGLKFEGPVCKDGKVVDWYALWDRERVFMIDMAGFAISVGLILANPNASMNMTAKRGHLEDSILLPLVTRADLEPKADGCSKVLVWHIRTEAAKMVQENKLIKKGKPSNPNMEV